MLKVRPERVDTLNIKEISQGTARSTIALHAAHSEQPYPPPFNSEEASMQCRVIFQLARMLDMQPSSMEIPGLGGSCIPRRMHE